jgi:HlyD family secretion protein
VVSVTVQAGDPVEAGDVLLTLDDSDAQRQIREAEAALALRRIALDKARTGGSDDEIEAARARLQEAVIARQAAQAAYDKIADEPDAETRPEAVALARAKAEEQAAENAFRRVVHGAPPAEIASLEQQVALAEIGLARARQALTDTRLTAPFAGTVLAVHAQPDEIVGPAQPLITLAELSTLMVVAQVDETDIQGVAVGQPAEVRFDAYPGQVISGTVQHVDPVANSQRGATVFETEIALRSPHGLDLRPGVSSDVTIITGRREGVLVVPRAAVHRVGSKKVVTLVENGRRRQVEVVTGMQGDQMVEIVSGLEEGQKVLVGQ